MKITQQKLKTIVLILTWNIIRKNKINIKTKERKKKKERRKYFFTYTLKFSLKFILLRIQVNVKSLINL